MSKFNLRFAANLSTMYTEFKDICMRYEAARKCGFKAVECQFPYSCDPDALDEARKTSGLEHMLINSYPGDMGKGEFGFACLPFHESDFKKSIETSIVYANALECPKIHVIAGLVTDQYPLQDYEDTYISNLKYAAELFEEYEIVGLIEPICPAVKKSYFLSSYAKGIEYIKAVNSPYMKLLLDVYHLQMLGGNVLDGIKEAYPFAGHIQISQAPGRQEPNYPGDINYEAVFHILQDLGYKDYIGLEYFPRDNTEKSLKWLDELRCEL